MSVLRRTLARFSSPLLVLAVILPGLLAASDSVANRPVQAFYSSDEPALGSILRFGRENKLPIGVIVNDQLCSTLTARVSIAPARAEVAVAKLAQTLPSYHAEMEAGVVVFAPDKTAPAVARFLAVVPPGRVIAEDRLQVQLAGAWMQIRAKLKPGEGTAFSILGSLDSPSWPELAFSDITIRELLNLLVARKDGAAWLLLPFTDFDKAADDFPISVFDYSEKLPIEPVTAALLHRCRAMQEH